MKQSINQQTGTFAPYMKNYAQTTEEQLEKNKPLMKRLKKWMEKKQAEEITEEEAKQRKQQWEDFQETIDSFRPTGHKLYTEE
ncbi:hypothetical protein [Crocosphaera sp.]|uniref:hypothetical protein n=1 Tax=Crocosphaera sp. TaxID=2729996 RepID=UPI00257F3B6D|nr:hypothetical protein [Crocosphaera sp.]NQZ64323.1 hypothetical protein [Crocosphaera sp.]